MIYTTYESPLGVLTMSTDGAYITSLHIQGDRYFNHPPVSWVYDPNQPLLLRAVQELADYFAGRRQTFTVPLRAAGTPFQQRVWRALTTIPPGKTMSYGAIATMIGEPSAARAVGTAIGRNPICILIPCHRVVTSSGALGGYVAGQATKRWLLALEQRAAA